MNNTMGQNQSNMNQNQSNTSLIKDIFDASKNMNVSKEFVEIDIQPPMHSPPIHSPPMVTMHSPPMHSPPTQMSNTPPMPPPPLLTRTKTVIGPQTESSMNFAQSYKYETKYHIVVRDLDLNKELPKRKPDTPMDTTLILDETGSMHSMKNEPVQSVNAYIKIQRESGFDVNIRIVRFAQVIKDMTRNVADPDLEIDDYEPDGMTALFDAVIYVILTSTSAQHVLITTDGDDNSSIYKIDTLNHLIKKAEHTGWTFTFIGCTKEAYKQGSQFRMSSQPIDVSDQIEGSPSLAFAFRAVSDNISQLNRQYTREKDEPQTETTLAIKMLSMHPNDALGEAWEYLYKNPWKWSGDSRLLNIKSTIDNYNDIYEYTNDKGLVNGELVHFNHEMEILGTIKDLGHYPIYYHGSFEIENHDFELCFEELKNHKIVFKPKKECAPDYPTTI